MSPAERAVAYARGGASMVSVLCDAPFFDGSWEHLEQVRAALDAHKHAVPLLAKEFVIDDSQIVEARHRGADAILLIARILSASAWSTWRIAPDRSGSSRSSRSSMMPSSRRHSPPERESLASTLGTSTPSRWTPRAQSELSTGSLPTSSPCICRACAIRPMSLPWRPVEPMLR